jgi:hypothetical protein
MAGRQFDHKIDNDILLWALWNSQLLKPTGIRVTESFGSLASMAVVGIPRNEACHTWPVVVSLKNFISLLSTRVARGREVVVVLNNCQMQLWGR